MPTPHLSAKPFDYAETVLMPGDPLRAKYIAENFFEEPREVNAVRGMLGFTGTYNGRPISVQGSGMGIPSIQIYATELVKDYGVRRIVRVGSCGSLQDEVEMRDVVVAMAAGTDSVVNRTRFEGRDFAAAADWPLLASVVAAARSRAIRYHVGTVFTSDFFYEPEGSTTFSLLERYGVLAVEMEAAGLYGVAAEYGFAALTVATVSDHLKRNESLPAEDRQTSFDDMIVTVLEAVSPVTETEADPLGLGL